MHGCDTSTVNTYPITNLISNINTNDYITFNNITCLKGEVATNSESPLSANVLPHFDIQFEMNTLSPTIQPTEIQLHLDLHYNQL